MRSEMEPVLTVEGLSKRYATYRSNIERFANWFGAGVKPEAEFWPVRDLSFAVGRGQAVAIIGQNGAGKSTLLKLITGTVRPTRGTVGVCGSINAILELGLGFNPEFTGRQNVVFAGGLMGLSQKRLAELMPEIEAFAEIGEFFDQPLRVYSSGMQARLAFALVTAERPDILIVDEVLAVGDSYFQHKSFDRIRRFKEEGSSILLVSHGMGDVRALCDRVILLDKGRVLMDGEPDQVVDYYNALIAARENEKLTVEQRRDKDGWSYSRSGNGACRIGSVALLDAHDGTEVQVVQSGQNLLVAIDVDVHEDVPELVLGCMLRDRTGHVVFGTNTWHTGQTLQNLEKGRRIRFEIRFACDLGQGSYGLSLALHSQAVHLDSNMDWIDNLAVFEVVNTSYPLFVGTSRLDLSFGILE
ncbi:ABC transporter ATP-binding protein [Aminobacter sp. J44]|uniref:ABC transporter ATP-binding protein n=1 Tax=Aminobacter sp. J44 TaxID=935262 RepID=UPI00119947C2|nr:ABC transporter ATP-binding protein [Aminobacter sp. J44]TWG55047.1 lipopolysaccharide transport system ATP-binding protein [Aminobacter sp. J44]